MILDQFGRPLKAAPVRARYDAAQTTDDNRKHWANADALSAVSANSAGIRRTLRMRSRYEYANSSFLNGIIDTISAYMIGGSGPTLQLTFRGDADPEKTKEIRKAASNVEWLFSQWAYARKLPQKLRTMCQAMDVDGESFAVITTAKTSLRSPVSLDFRLYEADHFDTYLSTTWAGSEAGVEIDSNGEPSRYAFSETHPGDSLSTVTPFNSSWLDADQVFHLFRASRQDS